MRRASTRLDPHHGILHGSSLPSGWQAAADSALSPKTVVDAKGPDREGHPLGEPVEHVDLGLVRRLTTELAVPYGRIRMRVGPRDTDPACAQDYRPVAPRAGRTSIKT